MNNTAMINKSASQWRKQRIAEMKKRALAVDSEGTLAQARALAYLLKTVAEWPNQINPNMIGWAGCLLEDTLDRLELALEIEAQQADVEVSHG